MQIVFNGIELYNFKLKSLHLKENKMSKFSMPIFHTEIFFVITRTISSTFELVFNLDIEKQLPPETLNKLLVNKIANKVDRNVGFLLVRLEQKKTISMNLRP